MDSSDINSSSSQIFEYNQKAKPNNYYSPKTNYIKNNLIFNNSVPINSKKIGSAEDPKPYNNSKSKQFNSSNNLQYPNEFILDSNKYIPYNNFPYVKNSKENQDFIQDIQKKNSCKYFKSTCYTSENLTQQEKKKEEKLQKTSTDLRKGYFFNNIRRNNTSITKDLKIILKSQNFIEEIDKFSNLKLSKNILERINMPPFRNVQIERKIMEDSDKHDSFGDDSDEPLRVNIMQILGFLVVLLIFFVIAVLMVIFIE